MRGDELVLYVERKEVLPVHQIAIPRLPQFYASGRLRNLVTPFSAEEEQLVPFNRPHPGVPVAGLLASLNARISRRGLFCTRSNVI